MRRFAALVAGLSALGLASAAGAVGPSLPAVDGGLGVSDGNVSYVTTLGAENTTVLTADRLGTKRRVTLPGTWGVPMVALGGDLGGLSPNGRVLVLSDNVQPGTALRAHSKFAVVDTRTLKLKRTISLKGDFSFDALSPQGKTLYLIDHVSQADITKYQVRAYDLQHGKLLSRVIADKRQAGWIMRGYAMRRTTSTGGRWVYTLYRQDDNYPFVHALDTVHRTAVCIGIPEQWTNEPSWVDTSTMRLEGGKLRLLDRSGKLHYTVDTKTFRVTTE